MRIPARTDLTEREKTFARQLILLRDDEVAAYRMAYATTAQSITTIRHNASEVLKRPAVRSFVAELRERAAIKFDVTMQQILQYWWAIGTADPNQLMAIRRTNCRHCWGHNFDFQWKDIDEWVRVSVRETEIAVDEKRPPKVIDDRGGYGFREWSDPNTECPKCEGLGYEKDWIADTTKLEGGARYLYAGFKRTKNGIEILTRNQDEAIANIAKAIGMFNLDSMKNRGLPDPFALNGSSTSVEEAQAAYKQIMGGTE